MADIIQFPAEGESGSCFCQRKGGEWLTWDKDHEPVLGFDGEDACIMVRVSPEQGIVGYPVEYCPWCGRRIANDE